MSQAYHVFQVQQSYVRGVQRVYSPPTMSYKLGTVSAAVNLYNAYGEVTSNSMDIMTPSVWLYSPALRKITMSTLGGIISFAAGGPGFVAGYLYASLAMDGMSVVSQFLGSVVLGVSRASPNLLPNLVREAALWSTNDGMMVTETLWNCFVITPGILIIIESSPLHIRPMLQVGLFMTEVAVQYLMYYSPQELLQSSARRLAYNAYMFAGPPIEQAIQAAAASGMAVQAVGGGMVTATASVIGTTGTAALTGTLAGVVAAVAVQGQRRTSRRLAGLGAENAGL